VTKVEEIEGDMIIHIDRLGKRLLRCGLCRRRRRKVPSVQKAAGVARFIGAENGVEAALPPTSSQMSSVRGACGELQWAESSL